MNILEKQNRKDININKKTKDKLPLQYLYVLKLKMKKLKTINRYSPILFPIEYKKNTNKQNKKVKYKSKFYF